MIAIETEINDQRITLGAKINANLGVSNCNDHKWNKVQQSDKRRKRRDNEQEFLDV